MSDTDSSARWALPFLQSGQAQKEVTHNEALARIDMVAQAGVVAAGTNDPPEQPTVGSCWIVGSSPSGDWSEHEGAVAGWTAGGWRFVTPVEGMCVWNQSLAMQMRHTGGGWETGVVRACRIAIGGEQVVGARQPAILDPAGGEVVDTAARACLTTVLSALRTHGLIAG